MHGVSTYPGSAVREMARSVGRRYGIFVHCALDPRLDRQHPFNYVKKIAYWPLQNAVLSDAAAVFFTASTECDLARTSFCPVIGEA